jgi:PPM family protein phosphatase
MELSFGAATDVGRVREVNEDSLLATPPVFVVADGMGGHHGGDVASRIVVEEFAPLADRHFHSTSAREAVSTALAACQRRILEFARSQGAGSAVRWYSGTTAVVAIFVDGDVEPGWLVANLGDSRAYRYADNALHQVSVDHSIVQELVDAGTITESEIATHPKRHVITRALGGADNVEADFFRLPHDAASRLLLCSDGITTMLSNERIAEIVRTEDVPQSAAESLVAAAVRAGGSDNATAVVIDIVGDRHRASSTDARKKNTARKQEPRKQEQT